MNTLQAYEKKWLARIIRVFAAKELFDAIVGLSNWGLSKGVASVDLASPAEHIALWAFFSLAVSIVLFRFAIDIARWLADKPRWFPRSLVAADGTWLYLGFRTLGVWAIVEGAGFALQGVIATAAPKAGVGAIYSGGFYLTWAVVYLLVGLLFAKRPDIVGIVVTSAGGRKSPDDKRDAEVGRVF